MDRTARGSIVPDVCRRWTQVISQLRQRAARARQRSKAEESDPILEDALLTCEAIVRDLAGAHLESGAQAARVRALLDDRDHLFQGMPVACVEVDASGKILAANASSAVLLNTSTKRLEDRLLMHFVEDRFAFERLLRALPVGPSAQQVTLRIRPRERAPLMVTVAVIPGAAADPSTWLWFLTPHVAHVDANVGVSRPSLTA